MIISELYIRGFKSFGHNIQTLKLDTDSGKLCLLVGKNGHGKSSLINSIEFAAYKKSRGRTKKWSPLSSLPNRHNKELLTGIKFQSKGVEVEVIRGINPDKFEVFEDGIINTNTVKYDSIIEDYIGMDVNSFRSFISLSVNDFKNFISLTSDEKQLLLDKLFNLEAITQMGTILRDLNRINKLDLTSVTTEIYSLEKSILNLVNTCDLIRKNKNMVVVDNKSEIASLGALIDELKPLYNDHREKKLKIQDKYKTILNDEKNINKIIENLSYEIKKIDNEISLYNSGKCPTCKTDFDSSYFSELRDSLEKRREEFTSSNKDLLTTVNVLKSRKKKLDEIDLINNKSYSIVLNDLKKHKLKITKLQTDSNKTNVVDLSEFDNSINKLKLDLTEVKSKTHVLSEKDKCYIELSKIFGEGGIRKTIISSMIEPINKYISENMKVVNLPFNIRMDESFNAIITQMGEEIDHDTLSTGENRLINIAILIAYLKLIRSKRNINVLFLDEIFSSIDVEGVDILLKLLSDFAKVYKINIFVVHHAIVSEDYFDRIIKLEKNLFTNIVEYK